VTPIDRVRAALEAHGCKPRGRNAKCPAHDDRNPSLSVWEDSDGNAAVKCHVGCAFEDIVNALSLEARDLFANDDRKTKAMNILETYPYVNERGELPYEVCRLTPKSFRQRRPDGSGGWIWNLDGTRRVLSHLPDVIEGVARDRWILIPEGERDVDRLSPTRLRRHMQPRRRRQMA
jgi:putative DNA primase/helicase